MCMYVCTPVHMYVHWKNYGDMAFDSLWDEWSTCQDAVTLSAIWKLVFGTAVYRIRKKGNKL